MSVLLQRGGNVPLNPQIARIAVAIGWDAVSYGGTEIDLDTSAFMVGSDGRVPSDQHFIFFNTPMSQDGSVCHLGNNTTGLGTGDDEVIDVELRRVTANIQKIVFTVTIYEAEVRRQHFGMVRNAFIRLVNRATGQELVRYNLSEQFRSETAMIFGELYRYKGKWKFRATGQGFAGGLTAMATQFGVNIGGQAASPPPPPTPRSEQPTRLVSPPAQPRSQFEHPTRRHVSPSHSSSPPAPARGRSAQRSAGVTSNNQPETPVAERWEEPPRQSKHGLNYQLLYPGPFATLKVWLTQGQRMKAESDAMVAMSNTIDVEGKLDGGILGGLARRFLTGEKLFFQELIAQRGPGEVLLAHAIPGEIKMIEMDGSQDYILQKDGFFASSGSIDISTKMQNLARGLFSGEGFFVMKASGQGLLFISSYGAIHEIEVPAGEEISIDNGHLVAWPDGMQYSIEKASSGWISSFTSGEAIICRFRGPGRVLIQTRNPKGFGNWLLQFIPTGGHSRNNSTADNLLDIFS